MTYKIDPERKGYADMTGFSVRAEAPDGSFNSVDIAELTFDSAKEFLIKKDPDHIITLSLTGHIEHGVTG